MTHIFKSIIIVTLITIGIELTGCSNMFEPKFDFGTWGSVPDFHGFYSAGKKLADSTLDIKRGHCPNDTFQARPATGR